MCHSWAMDFLSSKTCWMRPINFQTFDEVQSRIFETSDASGALQNGFKHIHQWEKKSDRNKCITILSSAQCQIVNKIKINKALDSIRPNWCRRNDSNHLNFLSTSWLSINFRFFHFLICLQSIGKSSCLFNNFTICLVSTRANTNSQIQ